MIPIKDKNIIVGVKYKDKFKWYICPKILWVFDLSILNPGQRIKYAKEISTYRPDLEYINDKNFTKLLDNISELNIDTYKLAFNYSNMIAHDERFIEDYLPSLYIDFDEKIYYYHTENSDLYLRGMTREYKYIDEDFLYHISEENRYWK